MNKDFKQILFTTLRAFLSIVGSLIVGKAIFHGQLILDSAFITYASGFLLYTISVVWSCFDKTLTIEMIEGVIRQTISFVGGLLITIHKTDQVTIDKIGEFFVAIFPLIQSWIMQEKNKQIQTGNIDQKDLKKIS